MHFSDDKTKLLASGNVHVRYKDYQIRSNHLTYDKHTDQLIVTDDIYLEDLVGNHVQATQLTLNLGDGVGNISSANIQTVNGHYVRADTVDFSGQKAELHTVRLSTCDLESPHYYFQSDYMRTNRAAVVTKGTQLFFYGVPIFYIPSFSGSVHEESPQSMSPKFGSNLMDGIYAQLNVPYLFNDASNGYVGIGFSEKRGWKYGGQHDINLSNNHRLSLIAFDIQKTGFAGGASYQWRHTPPLDGRSALAQSLFSNSANVSANIDVVSQLDYIIDRVHYNELYHSLPELTLSIQKASGLLNATWNGLVGQGYFEDRVHSGKRFQLNADVSNQLVSFSNVSFFNQFNANYTTYDAALYWHRLYNTLRASFGGTAIKNEISYTKVILNKGASPFAFDRINQIEDDELGVMFSAEFSPFNVSVAANYELYNARIRTLKYTVGYLMHCWILNVTVDPVWNDVSFSIDIPSLNRL